MKKILIVVPGFGTGGGERLAIDIATHIDKKKFEVTVLSLYPKRGMINEEYIESQEVNVVYLNKSLGFDFKIILKLFRLINNIKPDIIHTHLYVMPYVIIPTIFSSIKIRLHTVHSIASKEATGVLRRIMRFSYRYGGFKPIAICDYVKKTISHEYAINLNEISCVYNGIDISRIIKYSDIEKKEKEVFTFISTGRFEKVKNHELMIDAFALVKLKYDNIRLVLLGDGELKSDLVNKIKHYGLSDNIIMKGIVKNVGEELYKSDVYLMTSLYEGLPLSVLEAMVCGLPIITTNAGGVIDIVDNKNGIVISESNKETLSNAMIKLIEDRDLRVEMGKESRVRAFKYDIKHCVDEYEEIYKQ